MDFPAPLSYVKCRAGAGRIWSATRIRVIIFGINRL